MTGETNPSDPENKALTERLDVDFALKAARLGVWELDPVTNVINWDDRCRALFGLVNDDRLPYEQAIQHIHPDDVNRVDAAVQRAMNAESGGAYDVTYRTVGADDGQLRWVRFMGQAYFNDAGEVYRFAGVAQDVTNDIRTTHQVEESEARFRSLIEEAPVATCLFVGRELVIEVANQAILAIWGKGNTVLSKPLAQALPELAGQPFLQILDEVYTTGIPYEARSARADLEVDGVLRTYYFDFTYKPLRNAAGEVYAIMDMAVDVTEQVIAQQKLQASETYFRQLTDTIPAIIWMTQPDGYCTYLNKQWYEYTGQTPAEAEGYGWLNATHADDQVEAGRRFLAANEQRISFDVLYRLRRGDGTYRWAIDLGSPRFGSDGTYEGMIGTVINVHEQIISRQQLAASEVLFKNVTSSAPTGLWLSDEAGGLTYLNETLVEWTGLPYERLLGAGWANAIIDEDRPRSAETFLRAVTTRTHYDVKFRIKKADGSVIWCQAAGDPYYREEGSYAGYVGFCMDIDELISERQKVTESEAKTRSLIDSAPFPIGVYEGREMMIRLANQSIIEIWGKGPDVIGKPYAAVLPELKNQQIYEQLDGVYTTGIAFHATNQRVDVMVAGKLTPYYFNYSFTPLYNADGQIYGVMNTAADITGLALAKQQVEEAEAALRGAVDLAQLATWSLEIETGRFTYSARFMDWLGFWEDTKPMNEAYNPLPDEYRQSVADAIAAVIKPGSSGFYENEHPIINQLTGQVRIIHAQAQVRSDAAGKPTVLSGTAQDVTEQRKIQLALEQQVQQRTEELAATNEELEATNEELAVTNEELTATNEELVESTQLLVRSNENLQRFAYVASHDLQEPLRKVQQFGDLLKSRYGSELGEGTDYLERMQTAASRMSTLIRDLLAFSRISTQRETNEVVPIGEVVQAVLADLDLRIQETGAVIEAGSLPIVEGDYLQLSQLFQNLISNALKFRRPDAEPRIRLNARRVAAGDLPVSVRPTRTAKEYDCIDVSDNGIGFDEKYTDRIFQVFQRLHGVSQYAGTGIGLAICEKVVANHGGAITATSRLGQGATFSVYLPVT